jgi:benzoate-CoA ligase
VSTGELTNGSELVDRQLAAGRADKAAYIAGDEVVSYGDLARRVNQAGRLLSELGVRRENRVLIVLDDTPAFPAIFLGAMRIGAVPVPVSTLDKAENYAHYLADSYAEVVVTDAGRVESLRAAFGSGCDVRFVTHGSDPGASVELSEGLAAHSDELDPVATHADDMAFWLYSSGSTGKPKGVVHRHHDIGVTCRRFAGSVLGISEDDVVFSTTKLYHAYGLGNGLSFPLWFGATAVLMRGPTKPPAIIETLRRHRPTVLCSVPALYGAIVRDAEADGALDGVRMCVSAAEPLPARVFEEWRGRFGLQIVDGIGSTEMLHIYCSNRPGECVPGTSGIPVPGYALRLVDEVGAVIDGAAVGNLEVCGDSCAAYYWHQHEKTRRSMRGEWFATGDRYERREDGNYAYVGRVDDMIKVGGLWASPIDIEHVVLSHASVRGCGIIGVTVDEQSRIAAFVECEPGTGGEALVEELRALCRANLRRYEVPHFIEFVPELPRTVTGKVQRFRLRELAGDLTPA